MHHWCFFATSFWFWFLLWNIHWFILKALTTTSRRRARRDEGLERKLDYRGICTEGATSDFQAPNFGKSKGPCMGVHHSRDPALLHRIREDMSAPWKCKVCKRLCKASASGCGSCGGSWQECQDQHYTYVALYVESPRRPWNQSADWQQRPRQPPRWTASKSPRRRVHQTQWLSLAAIIISCAANFSNAVASDASTPYIGYLMNMTSSPCASLRYDTIDFYPNSSRQNRFQRIPQCATW